jgi:aminopeptidase
MTNLHTQIEKYADLAVQVGVNIQKNQTLVINASIESAPFVRLVTKKAYEAGARYVNVMWSDDEVTRLRYDFAPGDSFLDAPIWRAKEMEDLAEKGAALMSIVSSSPDVLKGVDPERIANNQKTAGKAMSKFRQFIQSDKISWTVIAVPSERWAKMVFPEAEEGTHVEKLWNAIISSVRADQENPVQAWKDHNSSLHKRVDYLNNKNYKKLHYTAPGTDLTIELPKGHLWVGAGSTNENGDVFMANMPTEEVFTVPLKTGVNGTVSSTKPLSYGGNIIDKFTLTFKDGRIVDVIAEEGEELLKNLVDSDEGAHYLGEIALVPFQSPISQSNILFYNTLFDENASNHLAIGNAYAFCIEGGKKMSQEELDNNGLNSSIIHEDFMIGSDKMDIDGITESGDKEAVFRSGDWAF